MHSLIAPSRKFAAPDVPPQRAAAGFVVDGEGVNVAGLPTPQLRTSLVPWDEVASWVLGAGGRVTRCDQLAAKQ